MINKTFRVIENGKVLFQSEEHWLIPWFDFETYILDNPTDLSKAIVHDKVIGKAAAMLMIRSGIGSLHAGVMSELAREFLEQNAIPYTYQTLVDRIECKTEEILRDVSDPEAAYQILYKRAQRC